MDLKILNRLCEVIVNYNNKKFIHKNPILVDAQSEIGKQIISNGRPQSEINKGMENHSTLFVERKENINDTKDFSKKSLIQYIKLFLPPIIFKILKK